ncbi:MULTISPECIES: peptidoglycan-associated lipoprotein Pal [unclassified Agarivorans]|uniref:peptidoglycan-associated lipoprotein Pal n=1 Tax=unclassified Agarivorans TaxID=2636026 RepID=UPI0010EE8C1C|nr:MULTISPECIES: peptidoglycan-associated lipoprotein Pal [unclassified Agarivorans]MDO6685064.1 peptidoglycan-associated lipoprotein Pal [Agarivorans sp. 3_MG-2023]MDO6717378.1 peptidoglycan-associated lipoprotein Pal [Agarivorans sp. 2_MG-2023]GDY27398.1 peptidoglycan-associated lipoprotein [Agarivorans sp. Toyoura001]
MQFERVVKTIFLGLAFAGLAACSSNNTSDSDVSETDKAGGETVIIEDTTNDETAGGVEVGSVDPVLSAEEEERQKAAELRQSQVVYFEFDRSDIGGEYAEILEAHASYLRDNPSVSVLIEGHTDEKGTPEYNIALGERRGKAVSKYLQSLGVLASQISIVSYGEEKPVDNSHTEAAMAKNRRAVLVY